MMGIGSSPGAPKSSIMFLMSMERSAILRSVEGVSELSACEGHISERHTSHDLDIVRADELDVLLTLGGRHGEGM